MNDRELLELAAKAAGYAIKWSPSGNALRSERGVGQRVWNPLADDGDALRLAAVLGLKVGILHGQAKSTYVSSWVNDNRVTTVERHGDDMMAATRRAIVRDAAAIGESMP